MTNDSTEIPEGQVCEESECDDDATEAYLSPISDPTFLCKEHYDDWHYQDYLSKR